MDHQLPSGYKLLGENVLAEYDGVRERFLYIEGVHPELHFFGQLEIVEGLSGGLETKIKVVEGLPGDYYYG